MKPVFWNKSVQQESTEGLKKLQLELLKKQINHAYTNSTFYRRKFKESNIHNPNITSLKDITRFPFTTREELERNFSEILAVPHSELSTIRMTSGTTGLPMIIAHTKNDIANITEASARKLSYHGVTNKDVVQITAAYGLWQAGWSANWGAEKIGACVIPVGAGDTERQIRLIRQLGTTVLYGATNFHFRIAEVAKTLGESLRDYCLKLGICVAEKPSKQQIETLKEEFGYEKVAIDYGATEFPGFSVNCDCEDFHHVWADYYLVEIVDPETHEPLEDGEKGELAITSLQREAFPLIRYLSRDVTSLIGFEECECGMSHPKIGIDIDREDYMTKIRGVPVFPTQIELILDRIQGLTGRCQLTVDKRTPQQESVLKIEMRNSLSQADKHSISRKIVEEVKNRIGITFNDIVFIPLGTFESKYDKAVIIK